MRICDLIISTNIARILRRFKSLQPQEEALQLVAWKFCNSSNICWDMSFQRWGWWQVAWWTRLPTWISLLIYLGFLRKLMRSNQKTDLYNLLFESSWISPIFVEIWVPNDWALVPPGPLLVSNQPTVFPLCWILICYLQIYLLPLWVAVSSSPWGKRVSTSLLPAMVPAKEKQWSPWWLVTGG